MVNGIVSGAHEHGLSYSGLKYHNENGKEWWEGQLSFTARFDSIRERGSFSIRIDLPTESNRFPLVKEIGGKTDVILAKWKSRGKIKNLADLHVNSDGCICFCPKPEEKRICSQKIGVERFISDFVIPYFFALIRFDKTGKWIWGEYSHGDFGIFEYYLDHRNDNDPIILDDCRNSLQFDPFKKQFNGKEKCFCGSKLKLKKCHKKAFEGYKAIMEDLTRRQQK